MFIHVLNLLTPDDTIFAESMPTIHSSVVIPLRDAKRKNVNKQGTPTMTQTTLHRYWNTKPKPKHVTLFKYFSKTPKNKCTNKKLRTYKKP